MRWWRQVAVLLLCCLLLVGCGSSWQAVVEGPAGDSLVADGRLLEALAPFKEEANGQEAVPLERVLVHAGHEAVELVAVLTPDSARQEFAWAEVADQSWWLPDGRLHVGGGIFHVARLEVVPADLLSRVQVRMSDVAPTISAAMGLPAPAQTTGRALEVPRAGHVLLVIVDGLGYLRYEEARAAGLVPHLAALGEPRLGLTVYPPITTAATAALLTGAPSSVNGVDQRGIRKTEAQTILEVAAADGRSVVAVEGAGLAFNLASSEVHLSGDRDGDGHTDDNVLSNTLAVLQEGMPDLLFVHFHGVDDAGHTYGPGAPEECARVAAVDQALGSVLEALPPDVLVIVLADHGMHPVQEDGRLGNHRHLIARDMFIPVWIVPR